MKEVIKADKLSKSYGRLPAVNAVSLCVGQGTAFGLLGANGAGKTTTMECMLGIKKPDSGTVSILGMDPRNQRKPLFQRVGVQLQENNYQDKITVGELCEVTACLYRDAADIAGLLTQFGLAEKTKSFVKDLSGGQRQRLFIVLALIPGPEAVFLDELTTGLDAKARRDIWTVLADMKAQGLTILMTSHNMDEVEALCDQIGILKRGELVFTGTVAEAVAASPHAKLEDAYLWFTNEEDYA